MRLLPRQCSRRHHRNATARKVKFPWPWTLRACCSVRSMGRSRYTIHPNSRPLIKATSYARFKNFEGVIDV